MINIVIGNIVALIASRVIKQKEKIIYIQTLQIGLSVVGNAVLGGVTGAITNSISIFQLCNSKNVKEG